LFKFSYTAFSPVLVPKDFPPSAIIKLKEKMTDIVYASINFIDALMGFLNRRNVFR